ncbi:MULTISPECIES: flagellar protein FliT [unclassified Pantoea]|uniref:flagellar protein FliT n=1 Tax=unclassified Pantoea TaxID=2630326 RepID=UPI00301E3E2D
MPSDVKEQIQALLVLNQRLIALAHQDGWEAFSEEIVEYTQRMKALCACDFSQADAACLAQLLAEAAQLMQCIPARLAMLQSEIAALRKSRHSARAYAVS